MTRFTIIRIGIGMFLAAITVLQTKAEIIPITASTGALYRNLEPKLTYDFPAIANIPASVKLDFTTTTFASHSAYSLSAGVAIVASDGWQYGSNATLFQQSSTLQHYDFGDVFSGSLPWKTIPSDGAYVKVTGGLETAAFVWSATGVRYFPISTRDKIENGDLPTPSLFNQAHSLVSDPVNVITGAFYVTHDDLVLIGPMPVKINRSYSSLSTARNELGVGWLFGHGSYLIPSIDASEIKASAEGGAVISYSRVGTSDVWTALPGGNPGLSATEGSLGNLLQSRITKTITAGETYFNWELSNGAVRVFRQRQFPISSFLKDRPYLEEFRDPHGNWHRYTYGESVSANDYGKINKIDASNGSWVELTYNSDQYVDGLHASDGRTVSYKYNRGDLVEVTNADNTKTQYAYGNFQAAGYVVNPPVGLSSSLLVREIKPDGRVLENQYDYATRRVTEQKATVDPSQPGVLVVNAIFDYSVPGKTKIKDAYGRETIYEYSDGLITLITDPLNQTITKKWYAATDASTGAYQHSLEKLTDPRGLATEYKYDSQGNVKETKVTGDLDGDPATPATETYVITAHYNTRNLPEWIADSVSGLTVEYLYEDLDYPYLATTVTTRHTATSTILNVARFDYTERSETVGDTTIFACGLLEKRRLAFESSDEAVTDYDYDATGFRTSEIRRSGTTDPDVTLTFAPTPRREILSITDAANRSTHFTYDGLSRPRTKTVKNEAAVTLAVSETTYNGNGEASRVDGPRSGPEDWIEHDYDQAGRPSETRAWQTQAKIDGSGVEAPPPAQLKAVTLYRHDLFGNLTLVIDPRGHATTHQYDALGRLTHTRRFDSAHTAALLAQNTADLAAKHSYDGTLPSGVVALSVESFTYEPGGQVETHTDAIGGQTTTLYNSRGQPRRRQNPDGSVLEWRYRADGRPTRAILRNSTYWETTYDDVARTVTRTLKKADGTVLATEMTTNDRRGNRVSFTDAENATVTTTYDDLDRPKVTTGPGATATSAQQVVTTYYDASGKTRRTVNALGEAAVTTSDALGRPVSVQVKDSQDFVIRHTGYAYSTDHQAVTVTQGTGTGAISHTTYTSPSGRLLLEVDGLANFTRHSYDLAGNRLTTTDALSRTTAWSYNALNQPATQTLPDENLTTFTHDAVGHLTNREMAGGLNAESLYDSAGRPTSSRLYSGATVSRPFSYIYYPSSSPWAGLLQATTTPRATVTSTYDDYLRPFTVTTDGSAPETDSSTTYLYDKRGRLTSVAQNSPSDAAGPSTTVNRDYDPYGQVTNETLGLDGANHSTVTQTWTATGRRRTLHEAHAAQSNPLFQYGYRADGLPTGVTLQNYRLLSTGFTYGDNGLLASRVNSLRALAINTRDAAGRILRQTTSVNNATAMVENQTWRDDGTLDTYDVTRSTPNVPGAWNEARSYGYNDRGQVTSEGFSPAPATTSAFAYLFDNNTAGLGIRTDAKVGSGAPAAWQSSATTVNLLARVTEDQTNARGRSIPTNGVSLGANYVELFVDGASKGRADHPGWADNVGAWSKTLTFDAGAHTLRSDAVHPSGHFTAAASSSFTVNVPLVTLTSAYDADGNVISRTWSNGTAQTLTWDAFNRLIKVSERDGANNGYDWAAVYDGFGRRLKTTWQPVAAGAATGTPSVIASIYDPQAEFLEIGVVVNGVKAWKVYGPDLNGRFGGLNGTGGLDATILDDNGIVKGVLNDAFGHGVATITGTQVTWSPTRVGGYGPLPNIRAEILTDITRVAEATAWRGRRIDPTGFYNLGARYYEPTSARFLSPDPMGHGASMSLYDFANGDPVNSFDPDGRFGKALYQEYIGMGERLTAGFAEAYNVGQDIFTAGLSLYMMDDIPSDMQFSSNTLNGPSGPTVDYFGVEFSANGVLATGQVATFGIPNMAVGTYDIATGDYQGAQDNYTAAFLGLVTLRAVTGKQAVPTEEGYNSKVQLARQLTSDEQLAQAVAGEGDSMAGSGTTTVLRDAPRLAAEYGGDAADWAKVGTDSSATHNVQTPAGVNFEIHYYKNVKTGKIVEIKTKIVNE